MPPITWTARVETLETPALEGWQRPSYTIGMKTAVSVPDDVFRAAERQARRTRKSRSQLYAEALSEYLARHGSDEVTDAMNGVVDQLKEPIDRFVSTAARRVLERSEW
jgi:metal-responsive CopG/Arc/MetJ family transcriptional regulator